MTTRTQIRNIIEGLELFERKGQQGIDASNDAIYGAHVDSYKFSPEELSFLKERGWSVDSTSDCWTHYT